MANLENLRKYGSEKEPREEGRKGGIRSGQVRKKKKELKERLKLAFEILDEKVASEIKDEVVSKFIKEHGSDVYNAWKITNDARSTPSEKLTAMKLIWSYEHGMPVQRNEMTGKDGEPLSIKIIEQDKGLIEEIAKNNK